jgi:hypothetical protein
MLTECASSKSLDDSDKCIAKAKLAHRLLKLCLKEVDECRVYLWGWLHENESGKQIQAGTVSVKSDEVPSSSTGPFKKIYNNSRDIFQQMSNLIGYNRTSTSESNTTEAASDDENKFSPSAYWKNAPHPSKHMYNLAFSSWKNVIDSAHSSPNTLEIAEKAARQVSSLLSAMEDDYSSDVEFVKTFNETADRSKYAPLNVGAAAPDVRTYGGVMNAWGHCVGSFLQPGKGSAKSTDDESFQRRLRVEASAIKAIIELKETMEEDHALVVDNGLDGGESTVKNTWTGHKRPPLDKSCYNIILSAMARQINPSLTEMRLIIVQMMKCCLHELEHSQTEIDDEDRDSHPSMECFPDVASYNALIEARANRSAMFASDARTMLENNNDMFQSIVIPHHKWNQNLNQSNGPWTHWRDEPNTEQSESRWSRKFTASEEEAIFAEQFLDEMCQINTVVVRPNIYSYNCEFNAIE